jgi:hypothetical protein
VVDFGEKKIKKKKRFQINLKKREKPLTLEIEFYLKTLAE